VKFICLYTNNFNALLKLFAICFSAEFVNSLDKKKGPDRPLV